MDTTIMQGELSEYPGYIVYSNGKVYSQKTKGFIGHRVDGYDEVRLKHVNGQYESIRVHRLIAQVFVENDEPDKKKYIHHIDGNKLNNDYTNLRWIETYDKNITNRKAVCQYTRDWKFIKKYASITDASRETGINNKQINKCCKLKDGTKIGKRIKYMWKYDDCKILYTHKSPRDMSDGKILNNLSNYIIQNNGMIYSIFQRYYIRLIPTLDGYVRVRLINDIGKKQSYLVHQLVMEAYNGSSSLQIKHKNGNIKDNRLENLEYVDEESRKRKRIE
jgi:hypothetical protein